MNNFIKTIKSREELFNLAFEDEEYIQYLTEQELSELEICNKITH